MRTNFYILLITIFFVSSCTEIIDIELNDESNNRLVVEGSITTEQKKHSVKLSKTSSYFSNESAKKELGATVTISDGNNIFILSDEDNDGIYHTEANVKGVVDKTYVLNIELKNGEKYFAEAYLQKVTKVDSLQYEYKKSEMPFSNNRYYYEIYIYAQEPKATADCYQWELYIDNIHKSDTLRKKTFISDELVNGIYLFKWPVYEIPENQITNEKTIIKIKTLSISKEDYDFKYALMLETDYASAGLKGPPANIPSNINNNALGFFTASDVNETSVEVYYKTNVN